MTELNEVCVQQAEYHGGERRVNVRYALAMELSYSVVGGNRRGEAGVSEVIDISSSGVRFKAERPLATGLGIEVAINWPALLDGRTPLQLVATGTVVRTRGTETAAKLERYVFKTRRMHETSPPSSCTRR